MAKTLLKCNDISYNSNKVCALTSSVYNELNITEFINEMFDFTSKAINILSLYLGLGIHTKVILRPSGVRPKLAYCLNIYSYKN